MQPNQTGYLYHWVPADLKGHILYPLNQLKNVYPHLYVTQVAKYRKREAVMQARIPLLNCLWNDVLHFSPVHPSKVQWALGQAGFPPKKRRYFEIDPFEKGLNATNAVIFLHERIKLNKFQLQEEDFRAFNPEALNELREIPETTQLYYRKMFEQGKRPLVYLYVPHILYRGILDLSGVRVIEVN